MDTVEIAIIPFFVVPTNVRFRKWHGWWTRNNSDISISENGDWIGFPDAECVAVFKDELALDDHRHIIEEFEVNTKTNEPF